MDVYGFNERIKPLLKGYTVEYSSFSDGDFGSLERVELEGLNKLATVEFWSEGWIGIDVFDCACDEQVMNILLSPEEVKLLPEVLGKFINILKKNT